MAAGPPPLWPSLRCRLGWHAPIKGARWNQGYYFTRCARCGADLVRTTFSGWEAPRGQRVVWRTKSDVEEAEQRAGLPAPPASARTSGRPAPPRRRPAASAAASAIPDFMDDPPHAGRPPVHDPAQVPVRSPGGDRVRS